MGLQKVEKKVWGRMQMPTKLGTIKSGVARYLRRPKTCTGADVPTTRIAAGKVNRA
jgi:hypothetical protein